MSAAAAAHGVGISAAILFLDSSEADIPSGFGKAACSSADDERMNALP